MVDIENVERKFINMIESNEFKKLQEYFNDSTNIFYFDIFAAILTNKH